MPVAWVHFPSAAPVSTGSFPTTPLITAPPPAQAQRAAAATAAPALAEQQRAALVAGRGRIAAEERGALLLRQWEGLRAEKRSLHAQLLSVHLLLLPPTSAGGNRTASADSFVARTPATYSSPPSLASGAGALCGSASRQLWAALEELSPLVQRCCQDNVRLLISPCCSPRPLIHVKVPLVLYCCLLSLWATHHLHWLYHTFMHTIC